MHGMVQTSRCHSNDVEDVEKQFPKQAFAAEQSWFVASCHVATLLQHQFRLHWTSQVHRKLAVVLVACHHEICSLCRIPLPKGNSSSNSQPAYVDWLYLDDDLRITRGSKGSMFIHTKS
jgi:hypothetical protein